MRVPPGPICRVLAIDDDPLAIQLIADSVSDEKVEVFGATNAKAGVDLFVHRSPHVVFLDLVMPDTNGIELLETILGIDPTADVVLITGHYSTESAVQAIQNGAMDYLTKPLAIGRLRQKIEEWMVDAELEQRALRLDKELARSWQFQGMVGRDPLMLEVFSRLRRVGPHFETALVTGPTGTGKELVAKALHRLSPFASGPFVVCDCGAIVETLLEGELFGHVRGAFTGALQDRPGLVESANGGTLFLDEVGELPLSTQVKLLRVLQNREVRQLGSAATRRVNVRVVAATNRDLRSMVAEGRFREDLYYRLGAVEIKLPRLVDRRDDFRLLEQHFLEMYAKRCGKQGLSFTRRAQAVMSRYPWPGNVRELENVIEYCCMMATGARIDARDFPEWMQNGSSSAGHRADELITLSELQRRHVHKILASTGGNRLSAAKILGIGRATLYRIIERDSLKDQDVQP